MTYSSKKKIESLDRHIEALDSQYRKTEQEIKEKKRERNAILRKQRTHRLIEIGGVVESVLKRQTTDEDITKLKDLLWYLENDCDHYFSRAMNRAESSRSEDS